MTHIIYILSGDETNWGSLKKSKKCEKYFEDNNWSWDNETDIHLDFFKKYLEIIINSGFTNIGGWEEVWEFERTDENGNGIGLYDIFDRSVWDDAVGSDTILTGYHWANGWNDYDASSTGYMMANKDYNVIMASATHLYFDHPQEFDPNARGLTWATRYSDLWKVFSYRPMSIHSNALYDDWGNKLDYGCIDNQNGKDFKCAKLEKPENIAGIQGHLWCEEIIKQDFLWTQMFPRGAALADRAWRKGRGDDSSDSWEDINTHLSWSALNTTNFKVSNTVSAY